MVVARRDISGERPQGVERRFVAVLQLFGHIAADHLHRHVARLQSSPARHIPRRFSSVSPRCAARKTAPVVGILNGAGAQAIAQRQRHVIGGADFADFAEMPVEEVFLMMRQGTT